MIALIRREWKVAAGFGVVGLIAIIEPGWAFLAVRFISAGIYAALLAASS